MSDITVCPTLALPEALFSPVLSVENPKGKAQVISYRTHQHLGQRNENKVKASNF